MKAVASLQAASCTLALLSVSLAGRAGPVQIGVEPAAKTVGRYRKIELTLPTSARAANPYDPCEIDVRVELTAPGGGKLTIPAFYYQPCRRERRGRGGKQAEWVYPIGEGVWKARFAPTAVGTWSCSAAVTTRSESGRSGRASFECVASPERGFVRVSRRDPRYLAFDDGSGFFALGQNVAFVYDAYKSAEMLRRLGENGANFARIWCCCEDWAMAVEARKSGWGRSWSWQPPIVHAPGRDGFHGNRRCIGLRCAAEEALTFSPTRPIALLAETRYRLTGSARTDTGAGFLLDLGGGKTKLLKCAKGKWTPLTHELTTRPGQWWLDRLTFRSLAKCTMYLKDLSLKAAAGGPELLAEADVNRPMLGRYNPVDCFQLDRLVETAEAGGLYLQLVLFTRDHYMPLLKDEASGDYDRAVELGKRLVRYFAARWGYSTHVAAWEYFNEMNPNLPTDRFYTELGRHFERVDVNRHLRANSAWVFPPKDYKHPKLDTADFHWYLRPVKPDLWKDAAAAVVSRAELARQYVRGKPALFSEFGMTTNDWKRPAEIDKDREFVHLHRALWASALSGLASTVCHWYWDDIHKKDLYPLYRPVAAFVADIPFGRAKLRPAAATCKPALRVVGLQSDAAAYLWIADPNATWWTLGVEGRKAPEVRGASVRVKGLPAGPCRAEWWDTRAGKVIKRETVSAAGGALRLAVPAFRRDIACKAVASSPRGRRPAK